MKVEKRQIGNFIVDLLILLEGLLIILSYFFSTDVTMNFLGLVVFLSYLLGLLLLVETSFYIRKNSFTSLCYFIIIISIAVNGYFFRDNFDKSAIFISSIMLLYYFYLKGLDSVNLKLLFITSIIVALFHIYGIQKGDAINSLNAIVSVWGNSNMTGIVYTSSLIVLIAGFFYVKRRIHKITFLLFSIILVGLVFYTQNRGSIITIVVIFLLLLINRKKYQNRKILNLFLILTPVLAILFYINLMYLISKDVLLLNKTIFVRPGWEYMFYQIIKNPMSATQISDSGGLNMAIAGIIEFGIIGYFVYIILFIFMKPTLSGKESILNYKHVAYLMLLSIFVQQSVENTLINGAYGLYFYPYILMGVANSKLETQKDKIKN